MEPADAEVVCRISFDAGARFATIADPRIAARAEDAPFTVAQVVAYVDVARAWVATDGDEVIGFLVADLIDGALHIDEVDVAPAAGRRGHGSRLMAAAV